MKQDIIIFGGSPFVNTIDLSRIDFSRFDILCINRPVHNIPVHYLVCYDSDFRACHNQEEVQNILKQNLNPVFIAPKTEFIHKTTDWKFKVNYISHNLSEKCLGFCMYTCSSAVNFAYLKGYKNVYLIGIDLEENNKPFTHWHGVTNVLPVPNECAKKAKEYLYQYKKWLNLYQCNPNVMEIWDIPYYDIKKIYRQVG